MSLNQECLNAAQQCLTAEELVQRTADAGHNLSLEQAQKIIDSFTMVEINEDDIDMVAGGSSGSLWQEALKHNKTCPDCQQNNTFCIWGLPTGQSYNWCNTCNKGFNSLIRSFDCG